MPLIDPILQEFDREAKRTRTLLAVVPEDKFSWQPHTKSMTLARLASHVAEIPGWPAFIISQDELRFTADGFKPRIATSNAELLQIHDEAVATGRPILEKATDEALAKTWTMYLNDVPTIVAPKIEVLRDWSLNHLVHHRGQLTVYLRLLDVPLPSIYGPSADSQG
jgi:uncharacterized damage-inducible protein DinB